jgi:uncharacterized LabA/DUF88 family protein
MKKRTIIYVDGFNLYYGCLKNSAYKWLDMKSLFTKLLDTSHHIFEIKYFTALISHRAGNKDSMLRQKIYLKAIQTYCPDIKIYYGHYLTHEVKAKTVTPPPDFIKIYKTEEKGTDVNIAVHMLNDAWLDRYDCGVVVSNDSDLAECLKLVKQHHREKLIGLFFPSTDPKRSPSRTLIDHADFVKPIRTHLLANTQLPKNIPNSKIYKPKEW